MSTRRGIHQPDSAPRRHRSHVFVFGGSFQAHPDEHILMFLDRAGWHQAKALVVPDNLTLDWLPPYSPQCNPEALVWREVRRWPFGNHDYDSMDAVETALEHRLGQLESSPAFIQSLTGFDWIINVILNAK